MHRGQGSGRELYGSDIFLHIHDRRGNLLGHYGVCRLHRRISMLDIIRGMVILNAILQESNTQLWNFFTAKWNIYTHLREYHDCFRHLPNPNLLAEV